VKKKSRSGGKERKVGQKGKTEAKANKPSSAKKASANVEGEKSARKVAPRAKRVAARKAGPVVTSAVLQDPKGRSARRASVEEWLGIVRDHIARTGVDGATTGACSVPDPNGGPNLCVEMTQEACGSPAVKGTWIGGNC
jgi:hypothetical protein